MIDDHVIHIGDHAGGAIDLLYTVPLVLVKELVMGTNHSKANSLASVMAAYKKLIRHAKILAGQAQPSALAIILAPFEINCGN